MNALSLRPEASQPVAPIPPSANHRLLSSALAAALLFPGILALSGCKDRTAPPPPDDATLLHDVQNRIATDNSISSEPIHASVQNATATLDGTVSSEAARSLAANDAGQVVGIRTVINNLTVQPASAQLSVPPLPPEQPARTGRHKPVALVAPPPPPPAASQPPAPPQTAPVERPAPAPEMASTPPPPSGPHAITLPADTVLPIRLNQTLDSATTQTGDIFAGVIASDIVLDGILVLPQGTPVSGRVSAAQDAAHFKGNSLLTVELTTLDLEHQHTPITTDSYSKSGAGRGKNTAEKIGGGAAVGAILGGIFGGGKGAAIGAAAGGGAGAGVNAATRGQQVQIPAETLVRFHLGSPVTLRVPAARDRHGDALPHNED